jgi:hypothetical protein
MRTKLPSLTFGIEWSLRWSLVNESERMEPLRSRFLKYNVFALRLEVRSHPEFLFGSRNVSALIT